MIQVDITEELERIIEEKMAPLEERILRAIEQIGKSKYMRREEVADELHVCTVTASKRIKKAYRKGVLEDVHFGRPILVNRKEFFKNIEELSRP